MTTDKTYQILRYTDAHFRGTGERARARIHVWDPEAKRTLCGLDVPYLRPGDTPNVAPNYAVASEAHCARCKVAQRKRADDNATARNGNAHTARVLRNMATIAAQPVHKTRLHVEPEGRLRASFKALAVALYANGLDWADVRELVSEAEEEAAESPKTLPRANDESFPGLGKDVVE